MLDAARAAYAAADAAYDAANDSSLIADDAILAAAFAVAAAGNDAYNAAVAAAHIAASAFSAADHRAFSFWAAIGNDATWLVRHSVPDHAAEALTAEALWLGTVPKWFDTRWAIARRRLQKRGAGFDLWTGWFERRIAGHAAAFALAPVQDREVQIKIVEQEDTFWSRDPAVINAEIQGWIDTATQQAPNVPPQHPHELQTIARDGRVARLETPPLPAGADQDARRRAAWDAIRAALEDYRAGGSSNESRLDRTIDRIFSALGETFEALNPIGIGVQAGYLQAYAERADAIFLPGRAADLVGLNMAIGRFLPQFAEWQAYLEDADARHEVTPEALAAATAVADLIAQSDAVEPEVKAPVAEMKADALDEASGRDLTVPRLSVHRERLLGAHGNFWATASKIALDFIKARMEPIKKGGDNGLEKVSERAVIALFTAAGVYLATLAGLVPQLAWLLPLLAFLKKNGPKD